MRGRPRQVREKRFDAAADGSRAAYDRLQIRLKLPEDVGFVGQHHPANLATISHAERVLFCRSAGPRHVHRRALAHGENISLLDGNLGECAERIIPCCDDRRVNVSEMELHGLRSGERLP